MLTATELNTHIQTNHTTKRKQDCSVKLC